MAGYVLRRLIQLVVVFIGVTLVIYLSVFVLPGQPIRSLAGYQQLPPSTIATIEAHYHLNEPFFDQYGRYVWGLLHGDLGTDFYGNSVASLMAQRWPVTICLAAMAWLFEIVFGVGIGLVAALRRGKVTDHLALAVTMGLVAVPAFVAAYVAQLVFGVNWHIFPIAGLDQGWPMSYILPAAVLGAFGFASVSRLMRGSVLDSLQADFVRTARAKGLPPRRVMLRHVLPNSLIGVLTYVAMDLGYLLSGTVIIEGVFNLPGIGQLLFTSIQEQEGTVVVGVATALVLVFLVLNLIVDLLYGFVDPRIRLV
ncbi:MAG TPA: ABC transporter permease [Acidimicrobiales bacterium]|nr:ABC transporter permease [Acidimicrobiales bacterium]